MALMVMIMANICNGEMRVLGSFESKKKLLDLFLRENSTNKEKVIHFARTWIKLGDESLEEILKAKILTIKFYCDWSVDFCLFNKSKEHENCPIIQNISKELNLDIEIASEESGMGFTEFYHINKGCLEREECDNFPSEEYPIENYTDKNGALHQDKYFKAIDSWYLRVYSKFSKEFINEA